MGIETNGIGILSLPTFLEEIQRLPECHHVVTMSRQFDSGDKAIALYRQLGEKGPMITCVDASAQKGFNNGFRNSLTGTETIRRTHERYSGIPVIGSFVGRNHIRLTITGETVYFSTFDYAEASFDRDEMFLKITDPELVQLMKIVALWDYDRKDEFRRWDVNGFSVFFDTGTSSRSGINDYLSTFIRKNVAQISEMWIVSSWYPDKIWQAIYETAENGRQINMLINDPTEYESIGKMPFMLTKLLSRALVRSRMPAKAVIYYPEKQFHAKFILTKMRSGGSWWFVGSSNFTNFGVMARTAELGISGKDESVAQQLKGYIQTLPVRRIN
ncbi:hypothetical protein KKE45_02985 [Patescibacteria group bacterium]|nr:hypothetical protein [Patescibacteria group bacterium]